MLLKKIKVRFASGQDNSYDGVIGKNCLRNGHLADLLSQVSRSVVITDSTVKKLHGLAALRELRGRGLNVELLSFPAGENSKSQAAKTKLEHGLIKRRFGRDTLIIALGGGVVGDLAGFTAATYLRGVPYVQIPTTFLAMVDSSVGGKTAINTPYGKNTIGAFWHPKKVFIDLNHLDTLPRDHLINGLVEAVKMFLTSNRTMFRYVSDNLGGLLRKNKGILQKIIAEAVAIKARIVSRDPAESGERMVLNFGHTVGHGLEFLSGFRVTHGCAVGSGILAEAKISELLGYLNADEYGEIKDFLAKLGVSQRPLKKIKAASLINILAADKKARSGRTRYVILRRIGEAVKDNGRFVLPVDDAILVKAINCV